MLKPLLLFTVLMFSGASAQLARSEVVISVTETGATGDGRTDDWWSLQQAIERAAALPDGGIVVLPDTQAGGAYRISQALRMRSNVTLFIPNPATTIRCTGDPWATWQGQTDPTGAVVKYLGRWPTYSCVLFGGYESFGFAQLMPDAASSVAKSDTIIQFTTRASAARYVVGDVIALDTTSDYSIGRAPTYSVPTWRQLDRVTGIDIGRNTISVAYPVEESHSALQVLRLTNGADTPNWPHLMNDKNDTGIPLWATHDAAVIGGTWQAINPPFPFSTGSGALDCRVDVHSVSASRGVGYGNAYGHCHFHAEREVIAGTFSELSEGSHHNLVEVNAAEASMAASGGDKKVGWYLGANESARDNLVRFGSLDIGATQGGSVVAIAAALRNTFEIGTIRGGEITGDVVTISAPAYGEGTPLTERNHVQIGHSLLESVRTYVLIAGAQATGNTIERSQFSGAISRPKQFSFYITELAGPGNVIRHSSGQSGSIQCDAGIDQSNLVEDVSVPLASAGQLRACRHIP